MPRRPLGEKAMTATERTRKRRARLRKSQPRKWRTVTEIMHRQMTWKLLKDAGLIAADAPLPESKQE